MAGQAEVRRGVVKRGLQLLVSAAVMAAALFLPAGTLNWWQAWAYLGIFFGVIAFNALFILRDDPELIAERAETKQDVEAWDKTLTNVITVLMLAVLVVAGLDLRFGFSSVPRGVCAVALLVVVGGNAIVSWAMSENTYFSRGVRIQDDRGQCVCSTGPYAYVRHPGYLGIIVYSLATPIGLGSWWAVVPAVLVVVGFVARTSLEERTLEAKLAGYAEYASRVRYRLIPAIW
jgi:protein-S-isoprenylcysteine O-methyltransferase Ste14